MGLQSLVSAGVAIASSLTASLRVTVTHEAWTGTSGNYATPTYATGVSRTALVEMNPTLTRLPDGTEVMARATVTFLDPISAQGASGRREPIDPRDKITLHDGTTGPILSVSGLANPDTNLPYLLVVTLG